VHGPTFVDITEAAIQNGLSFALLISREEEIGGGYLYLARCRLELKFYLAQDGARNGKLTFDVQELPGDILHPRADRLHLSLKLRPFLADLFESALTLLNFLLILLRCLGLNLYGTGPEECCRDKEGEDKPDCVHLVRSPEGSDG
jgi:hypothetical protein